MREAIRSLPAEKALGLDGFIALFYQQCWPIIKPDAMAAILKLGSLAGNSFFLLNQALITLLPKKPEPQGAKDYRPISFLHSFAKIFSNILTLRLALEMAKIVAPNQTAFIAECSIQDNFFLARQSARVLHQLQKPTFLCKVDIAQAFDSVSWPFLLEVLRRKGFGLNWCAWLAIMLSLAFTRILLNGQPGRPIWHGRGLLQGDPLSLMLFVVVMGVLNNLIALAEESSLLQPLGLPSRVPHRLSLYANDAALFLSPVTSDLLTIRTILQAFGEASGLRTSLAESSISPIRCSPQHL